MIKCSLEDLSRSNPPIASPDSHSARSPLSLLSSSDQHGLASIESSSISVNVLDLELYNNFMLEYVALLSSNLSANLENVQNYTALALNRKYLLHSQLAVSAMQIYYREESRHSLVVRAAYLQNTALALAKPHMVALPANESIPMLFLASQIAIYGFASGALQLEGSSIDPLNKLLDCFRLVRGIRTLLEPHWRFMLDSWVGPILQYGMTSESGLNTKFSSEKVTQAKMLRSLALGLEFREQRQACLNAIDTLFRFINAERQNVDLLTSARVVQEWAVSICPIFETLLLQHKPVTLIILAHYAVLLSMSKELWWVKKWPRLILEYVESYLDAEWDDFLSWPRMMIENDKHVESRNLEPLDMQQ